MEVRPGYKLTEVGVIPEDWGVAYLGDLLSFRNGVNADKSAYGTGMPFINVLDVVKHTHLRADDIVGRIELPKALQDSFLVRYGDILFNRTSETGDEIGLATVFLDEEPVVFGGFVIHGGPQDDRLEPSYPGYAWRSPEIRSQTVAKGQGAIHTNIGQKALAQIAVPLPPRPEQEAIAAALGHVDGLLEALDRLIAKRRAIKQGAMQQLLTGETRLPGFEREWETRRIADVASPTSERNVSGDALRVLTCSKHLGFVDSLSFFKNQVFSKDLSTYRVIRRGEIGYPANHIEEGSIGLQDLYDIALVSPIYVVFATRNTVDSFFLHRLLKLNAYRQEFSKVTASSVNRRGSLRWPEFSEILVRMPDLVEQKAIIDVLKDMESELVALGQQRAKTQLLKQGMMQELLTGKTRLI